MKPIHWIAATLKTLKGLPEDVRQEVGYCLFLAQKGDKAFNAVPMLGFSGASVVEVVVNCESDTFRTVYTVKFAKAIYVLHVFQKKSVRGISTPLREIEKVRLRLKTAETHYKENYETSTKKGRQNDRSA